MNRRGFLGLLGKASIGAYVAYSFPNILIPKNIVTPYEVGIDPALGLDYSALNIIARKEIYPELIEDIWFVESPMFAKMKNNIPTYEQLQFAFNSAMLDKSNPNYYLNV